MWPRPRHGLGRSRRRLRPRSGARQRRARTGSGRACCCRVQPAYRSRPPPPGQRRRPGPARSGPGDGKPPRLVRPSRRGEPPLCPGPGNTGYARQDQADLCLETPPWLVVSLVINGHADSPLFLLGVGNCLALSEGTGDPDTEGVRSDPAQLLALTLSRPQDALIAARSVLAGHPGAYDASLAHHAIGIVLRDRGKLPDDRRAEEGSAAGPRVRPARA